MSYWDKIKELLSLSSKPEEKEEDEVIFTPEELREMKDPDTAVGRLLNPYETGEYSYGGPRELFYKGKGSAYKSDKYGVNPDLDIVGLSADAYIKDAEKRGIIHPDEDRIAKDFKIIEDIKKRKNLEHIPIKFHSTPGAWGAYYKKSKSIQLDPEKINPFYALGPHNQTLKDNYKSMSLAEILQNAIEYKDMYEEMPLSEQKKRQKLQNDLHLNTTIHELRHAEERQNEPEHPDYPGHFKDARIYNFENEDDAGKIYDIQAAALQRLSNIGTKKRKNTIPTSEE